MPASELELDSAYKGLVFGSLILSFDIQSFKKPALHLQREEHQWALDVVLTLSDIWRDLVQAVPRLHHLDGEELLKKLRDGLQQQTLEESLVPLPNILVSPLTVLVHLTQYADFLKARLPELENNDQLPASLTSNSETIGLCISMLSAFAVSGSSSLAQLQRYGAVAMRIAMAIGALVDAEKASNGSEGTSMSLSIMEKFRVR